MALAGIYRAIFSFGRKVLLLTSASLFPKEVYYFRISIQETDIFAVRQFIDVTRRRSRLTERGRRFFI